MTLAPTDRSRVRMVSVPPSEDVPAHVAVFVEAWTEQECAAEVARQMSAREVSVAEFRHPVPTALDTWVAIGYMMAEPA